MGKDCVHTRNGNAFNPSLGVVSKVELDDIAHGLSYICRYAGQCGTFYSVAEHSILVSQIVQHLYPEDLESRWAALLHDATEAYVCDLPTPIKRLLPDYEAMEERLSSQISEVFDIRWTAEVKRRVKEADILALTLEMPALFEDTSPWTELLETHKDFPKLKTRFGIGEPAHWKNAFAFHVKALEKQVKASRP